MPNQVRWRAATGRQALYSALRGFFAGQGYLEVETPLLVPTPGMEPHITAFEAPFVPETDVGQARPLYLHTSPEYAMKRLLAEGAGPLFQICKVFRNGEVSPTHNPEFTMLEFYRPNADYHAIMEDLEQALAEAGRKATAGEPGADPAFFTRLPYERLTVRDAVLRATGVDLRVCADGPSLKRAAEAIGVRTGDATSFDDVFFHLFLQRVERGLGHERPTFLIEYPASMAALSRLKPGEPAVAERVELYAKGLELANGFSELTDPVEQRTRLLEEQTLRRQLGRTVYPLDERFLEAVGRMPPSAGIAVGLDRILMLLMGAESITDVLLFPAHEFV
ncbi:EF-P lysine aminoacylase EpmA [Hyalangium rubrum]|uniref:EF-P lysine aminoacylase EpmA n=1 Tax=Hyalangium rubrum TaxID=3103134 RepID=A0ABU5H776_9BACT|nr:EF-P lysine aminoacylase EpmA [Hyalangium sp. s54d21]MDY7228703.1 EF-P lysine aminoacylase EpmA [Hyalangium sp. s54d21]